LPSDHLKDAKPVLILYQVIDYIVSCTELTAQGQRLLSHC